MFEEQAKHELFETVKAFHACKQEKGQSDYDQFIQNYNMHSIRKTIAKLHVVLKLHEKRIPKNAETPAVLAIREGKIQKDKKKPKGAKGKDKGKNKLACAPKPKIPPSPKRDNMAKDSVCHHCKEVGHYSSYQAELKKRKNASVASTSGIFIVELYAFSNKTWVYDTGCGTHICNTSQVLRGSRKLKHRALSLSMGNGMRVAVEAIGSFDLVLPSGLIIVLDNSIREGKIQKDKKKPKGAKGKDKGKNKLACAPKPKISPSPKRDNMAKDSVCHHCKEVLRGSRKLKHRALSLSMGNGMRVSVEAIGSFDSFYVNVSNKRANHALDSSYLWNYRLGHINKKRMDKLQRDGILQPTHDESLEKCKSCKSGKIARKPFSHQVERAKDLLGLIHTNRYSLEYAARILNMVPTKKVERTPYEIWYGKAPKLSYLKETMGYYFYYPLDNKIFATRNAEFFKSSLMVQEASGSHGLLESSGSDEGLELIQEEDTQPSKNTSEVHNEVAPIEAEPQNVKVPICRSIRIPQVLD
nr:hypothetical protein [Tanacetum cinerariifolium]